MGWLQSFSTVITFLPILVFASLLLVMLRRGKREAPLPPPDKYDQLRRLAALKNAGILDEGEFESEKRKILEKDG